MTYLDTQRYSILFLVLKEKNHTSKIPYAIKQAQGLYVYSYYSANATRNVFLVMYSAVSYIYLNDDVEQLICTLISELSESQAGLIKESRTLNGFYHGN